MRVLFIRTKSHVKANYYNLVVEGGVVVVSLLGQ